MIIESLWDLLGQHLSLLFGYDCASATIMMFASLCIRLLLTMLGIETLVPVGFMFAFPTIVQMITTVLPFTDTSNPLLTVRIAETLLGRISPSKLTVVIPAHFLGSIVGAVCFRTVLPFVPFSVVAPIISAPQDLGM